MEALEVCDALGHLRFNLPFHFHRDAVAECRRGDIDSIRHYLAMAAADGWTISEMRSQIRQDRASEPKSSHGPISVSITTELRRLSQRLGELLESNPLDQWDSGQLEGFLSDAEPFLKVARSVKARFAELNPDLPIQADQWVPPKRSKIRTELFYPYFKYTKMKTSELSGSRFSRRRLWRR